MKVGCVVDEAAGKLHKVCKQ